MMIVLYDRLRSIARVRMSGQSSAHTLDPTSLANEAILRLLKCEASQIRDEQHFLALAAEAMRHILVDHARAKAADKRGGGVRPMSMTPELSSAIAIRANPDDVLALSEALTSLEAEDPEAATIVKMRSFVGMDMDEIAALLGVSKRTVERRYRFAMADLRTRLGGEAGDSRRPPDDERAAD